MLLVAHSPAVIQLAQAAGVFFFCYGLGRFLGFFGSFLTGSFVFGFPGKAGFLRFQFWRKLFFRDSRFSLIFVRFFLFSIAFLRSREKRF